MIFHLLTALLLFVAVWFSLVTACDWRDGKDVQPWRMALAWSLFYLSVAYLG